MPFSWFVPSLRQFSFPADSPHRQHIFTEIISMSAFKRTARRRKAKRIAAAKTAAC